MSWNPTSARTGPIRLLLCSPNASDLYARLAHDARFTVMAVAATFEEALRLLPGSTADAAVVDGSLCEGPGPLQRLLADYPGRALVVAPANAAPERLEEIRRLPNVADVVYGDRLPAALDALAAGPKADASDLGVDGSGWPRFQTPAPGPYPVTLGPAAPAAAPAGWRCIAVWSLEGGSGRTTLARALAQEATGRGLPTLLVGLAAPDPLPLQMGRNPEPNLLTWRAHPTVQGLQGAVRPGDGHHPDLLAGFLSPPALGEYAPESMDGPTSLPALAAQAARLGYAVVILDVSAQELAPPALAAANTLVLVNTPTLQGALAAVEALRLAQVDAHMAPEACHLVLNGVRQGTLTPEAFVRAARPVSPDFPTPTAVIPDDPAIPAALTAGRSPYMRSEALRAAARRLADLLLAVPAGPEGVASRPQETREVLRLGPVVFTRT